MCWEEKSCCAHKIRSGSDLALDEGNEALVTFVFRPWRCTGGRTLCMNRIRLVVEERSFNNNAAQFLQLASNKERRTGPVRVSFQVLLLMFLFLVVSVMTAIFLSRTDVFTIGKIKETSIGSAPSVSSVRLRHFIFKSEESISESSLGRKSSCHFHNALRYAICALMCKLKVGFRNLANCYKLHHPLYNPNVTEIRNHSNLHLNILILH